MKVVVVIPVGPGHAELSIAAIRSVNTAWEHSHGPFAAFKIAVIFDLEGGLGRSAARNRGMDEHPTDWYFLLDADDEMLPEAFGLVDLNAPATFGAVSLNNRITEENQWPVSRDVLFSHGARGTLSMGCFVRGDLGLRFDETLDVAEDFDFYLRLPGFTKRREPLVSIRRPFVPAGGPRSSAGCDWTAECARVINCYWVESQGLIRTDNGNYYDPKDPGESQYPNSPPRLSVTDDEVEILADLARQKVVLEIGTGLGISTRALASTAKRVVTIDPDPWVRDPEMSNVVFLREAPMTGQFDIVFIDGHHSTEAVLQDITYCIQMKILKITLHDTYLPSIREAIRQCALHEQKVYETRCRLAVYTHN